MNIEDKKRHARFMIRLLSVAMKAMEKGEAINGEILDVAIEGSAELVDLCKLMYEVRRSLPAFSKWSDYDIDALSKGVGEALKSGDRSEELMREVEKLDFETLAGIIFCAEFGAMPPYMKSGSQGSSSYRSPEPSRSAVQSSIVQHRTSASRPAYPRASAQSASEASIPTAR